MIIPLYKIHCVRCGNVCFSHINSWWCEDCREKCLRRKITQLRKAVQTMPDKKLTDNEIVKALECCCDDGCPDNCPLKDTAYVGDCIAEKSKSALDLINRQKEEIERLKESNEKQRLIIESVDDNMFPLPFETDYDKAIKTAKSEARKEFAERLKEDFKNSTLWGLVSLDRIDNLLKEMESEKI